MINRNLQYLCLSISSLLLAFYCDVLILSKNINMSIWIRNNLYYYECGSLVRLTQSNKRIDLAATYIVRCILACSVTCASDNDSPGNLNAAIHYCGNGNFDLRCTTSPSWSVGWFIDHNFTRRCPLDPRFACK